MHSPLWLAVLAVASYGQQPIVPVATGPAVGAKVPAFELADVQGHTQTLSSIAGPKGALLVFFRSADW